VVHQRGRALPRHGDQRRRRGDPDPRLRGRDLTRAFEEITGIKVNMQIMGEGDVVQASRPRCRPGRNIYDMYVNDADLIGMHFRLGQTVNLTEWMAGEGADVTNPTLDIDDFIGTLRPPGRTASSGSCPTSSSPTCTGSARTGSTARTSRSSSATSTATTSACRSTGRPMRTSPSSSPRCARDRRRRASTATWTTASARPTSAGA
jgi:hypothetical protein